MSELEARMQWQSDMGLNAANLLVVAHGGHPDQPATIAVITAVRDNLTALLKRIEDARTAAKSPEPDFTRAMIEAQRKQKGKRK